MNISQTPISCLPVSLFQDFFDNKVGILDWAAYAAGLGLDCIDMNRRCLPDVTTRQAEVVRKNLAVPLMMVTTYSDFTAPEASERAAAVGTAKEDIRITGALGGKYIRLTAGQHYPMQDEKKAIEYIFDGFAACIPTAEAAGVRILLENHSKPGAWRYPDFNFHFERMMKLWEKIRTLPIGVNFDTANGYALGNWNELVDAFGDRIEAVHVNDLESVTPLKFGCVGEGIVPQIDILRAVWKHGFCGPVCIEEACMRGKAGIETAFRNTRSILKKL